MKTKITLRQAKKLYKLGYTAQRMLDLSYGSKHLNRIAYDEAYNYFLDEYIAYARELNLDRSCWDSFYGKIRASYNIRKGAYNG